MSALRETRELRHLAASSGNTDSATVSGLSTRRDWFASNAFPLVATLTLVWLATVALVFVNQFVQLDFVPLVYMLPVVVAAPQKVWTDSAGIIDGAIEQKQRGLASPRIVFDVLRAAPLVHVDRIAIILVSIDDGTLHAASEGLNLGTTVSLRLPIASTDTPEFVEASNA